MQTNGYLCDFFPDIRAGLTEVQQSGAMQSKKNWYVHGPTVKFTGQGPQVTLGTLMTSAAIITDAKSVDSNRDDFAR